MTIPASDGLQPPFNHFLLCTRYCRYLSAAEQIYAASPPAADPHL